MSFLNSNMSGVAAIGEAQLLAAAGQREIAAELMRLAGTAFRRVAARFAGRPSVSRQS